MHIVGLDAHSATFTLEIVNARGRVCREVKRDTSAENLLDSVREVPGPKVLVVEDHDRLPGAARHALSFFTEEQALELRGFRQQATHIGRRSL
jgi:hypothetical protein